MPIDTARILRLYRTASAETLTIGRRWYRDSASEILSLVRDASGGVFSREQCAGIVSVLSPRKSWRTNVKQALDVGRRYSLGMDPAGGPGIFSRVRPLIRGIVAGMFPPDSAFGPGAHKTSAFYRNLLGDLSPVTVDIWAARVVGRESADLSNADIYGEIAQAYTDAAETLGDAPASVQAVVWCRERGAAGGMPVASFFPWHDLALGFD